eukprot:CAMPEP_0175121624 /NCGR_PEP_ID=MMETSP0087-20121206/1271_1 /TAXON_ID=136419 /ORGANISM="Unknown Unknown, Strain D1" /LENGTH=415 /DNA_ID=CAMNT_0016403185 /DNA_START=198 /DNA_END=1445 /DNA_ORIENTATION=+
MYNDAERLYMVQSIKWVKNAAMSQGVGVYDFETDMDLLKPDIYFVNEDASQMEGRVKLCQDRGIKMIIQERKPFQNLAERSSTDMKARLKATVQKEQSEEESKRLSHGIDEFNHTIPWRFCFAGGWMDLKWCNELFHGCVVTINIKFHPGVCKDMCGLATSSRKHAIKLWNGVIPKHLEAEQAAQMLYGVENFACFGSEQQPYSAGSQDHCGLMFPGINKLCYEGKHWPAKVINLNDVSDDHQAKIFKWLESVLWVVEIPFVSRPGDYNSQRVNYLKDPNVSKEVKVAMVKSLAEASESAWNAICQMDSSALGKALSDTMAAWAAMLPYTVDPFKGDDDEKSSQLREFWRQYDAPHTKGCLFSGAGGGFLMVISDSPVQGGMQIEINHDHFAKPFPSDTLGSSPRPCRYHFEPRY